MAKRKRQSRQSTSYYILEITDWDWDYHFGLNTSRYDDLAYSDYRHLHVRGTVLLPTKLRPKVEQVELTFLPNISPADLEKSGPHPVNVGYLHVHRKNLTGGISMARDALDLVLQMLIAGRFRYLVMYGEPMRYGKTHINSYHFNTALDPEDYPDA
jgi:hypothetical protein